MRGRLRTNRRDTDARLAFDPPAFAQFPRLLLLPDAHLCGRRVVARRGAPGGNSRGIALKG
eukprot:4593787-Pyramimonas_sp.AAC.1